MISNQVWKEQLPLLCAHFNFELLDQVESIWREYLDSELDSAGFVKAVKTAIIKCPVHRPPTAEQLAEFGNGGMKTRILNQWERIDQGRKGFPKVPCAQKEFDQLMASLNLDAVALKVLKLLGGLSALSQLSEQDIKWSRDRFIEYYQLWYSQQDQLELEAQEIRMLAAATQGKLALPPSSVEQMPEIPEFVMETMDSLYEKTAMSAPVKRAAVGTPEEYQTIAKSLTQAWRAKENDSNTLPTDLRAKQS